MGRTGRRPGGADTRGAILAAARRQFTEAGYSGATIRGIAADAEVDPALVHHYFGAKHELFAAAIDIPVDPAGLLPQLLADGTEGLGERIVLTAVTAWDGADANPALMALRSMADDDLAGEALREFIASDVIAPLARALELPDATLRATLTASQLVGLIVARYVARLEPLASLSAGDLAALVGPTLQRYLTGDLPR